MAQINVKVLLDLDKAEQGIKGFKSQLQGLGDSKSVKNVDNLRKSYANLINTIQGAEKNYAKGTFSKVLADAKKGLNDLTDPAKKASLNLGQLDDNLQKLQADFAQTRVQATNFHGSLKDIIAGFAKFQMAAMLVMKPLQLINDAFDSLNETLVETEKRVVALRRVAGDVANANELYELAQKYGKTFEDVSQVVENFAKSGYDWAESIKAAESALIAMNVAELNAEQSSEGLIAIMKQFGYEINDLNYIIDVLNKTADSAAVTTEELLIALQKSGSTAKNANLSFEETVGLITALSEGTAASGQNIGNALRSLFIFTSDNEALDVFAGLSKGMSNTVDMYRAGQASILDVWKGLGAELGKMESSKGMLSELFGATDLGSDLGAQLTQIEDQFAEIYGTAGNYRQNYFIALLNNLDEVTKATENLNDVEGYSQKENLQYLNTYEAKVTALKAQWQELANDEQGFLQFKKDLVEIASLGLTILEWTGGLQTTLVATSTVAAFLFGDKILSGITKFGSKLKEAATAGVTLQSALGWIGVAATVFSVIDGVISRAREAREERARESIDQANVGLSDLQNELDAINNSYEKTIKEIEKYRAVLDNSSSLEAEKEKAQSSLLEIQNSLIESNNAYAGSLDLVNGKLEDQIGLTKDMQAKEAIEAVKAYQEANAFGIKNAEIVNNATFSAIDFDDSRNAYWSSLESFISSYNKNRGNNPRATIGSRGNSGWGSFGSAFLLPTAHTYYGFGEQLTRDQVISLLSDMQKYLTEYTSDEELRAELGYYLNTEMESLMGGLYDSSQKLIYGDKSSTNWIERLSNAQRASIASGNLSTNDIIKLLEDVGAIQEEITKDSAEWRNSLDQIGSGTLDKLVEKLKEARDASKESYDYENKKKAVLEAEKALMDAQNNRMSRVYNSRTGQWEWASNERTVQDAEEALEKARLAVEKSAYDNIIELLKSDNITNAALLKVMARWAGAYGSGDFSSISATVKSIVQQTTGVDLNNPVSGGAGLFDNGGILRGLGGIKATSSDEMVIGPTLTKSILSPVSNKQFDTFIKDLGILFGVSESARKDGASFRDRGGFSDSHDTSYVINGVPISQQMAETNTVGELLRLIPLID